MARVEPEAGAFDLSDEVRQQKIDEFVALLKDPQARYALAEAVNLNGG